MLTVTGRLLLVPRGYAINHVLLHFRLTFFEQFRFKQHFNELRDITQRGH